MPSKSFENEIANNKNNATRKQAFPNNLQPVLSKVLRKVHRSLKNKRLWRKQISHRSFFITISISKIYEILENVFELVLIHLFQTTLKSCNMLDFFRILTMKRKKLYLVGKLSELQRKGLNFRSVIAVFKRGITFVFLVLKNVILFWNDSIAETPSLPLDQKTCF